MFAIEISAFSPIYWNQMTQSVVLIAPKIYQVQQYNHARFSKISILHKNSCKLHSPCFINQLCTWSVEKLQNTSNIQYTSVSSHSSLAVASLRPRLHDNGVCVFWKQRNKIRTSPTQCKCCVKIVLKRRMQHTHSCASSSIHIRGSVDHNSNLSLQWPHLL